MPLDAWVVERESLDPLSYAELWIRDGGTLPGTPGFARLVDAWLDDFAAREVTEIGFGYVLLRRPVAGAPTLARYERAAAGARRRRPRRAPRRRARRARSARGRSTTTGLAASVLVVAPDVTEARHHLPGAGGPDA